MRKEVEEEEEEEDSVAFAHSRCAATNLENVSSSFYAPRWKSVFGRLKHTGDPSSTLYTPCPRLGEDPQRTHRFVPYLSNESIEVRSSTSRSHVNDVPIMYAIFSLRSIPR
ncbi:hypothetical protein V1478_014250 [Vespula squamosa]|uniref:Uncharacterized protein n=1 Tax=Vespula squamosa TaxID=30214 RepID=A0ABD2A7I6_VESSQ